MLHGSRIAVVIPAYDEAAFIEETVRSIPAFVDLVVVIDDASCDGTATLVRALVLRGEAPVDTVVLRHGTNRGVGASIVHGYRVAFERGAQVVAVMAGDGQMDPADLEEVVSPVATGAFDYVKGNRLSHPSARTAMPTRRRWGTTALGWLTGRAIGLAGLSDSQCGYTAIGRRALATLPLDDLWRGYGYPNDLLAMIVRERLRVAEVVVRPVYRGERSGLRPWHVGTIGVLIARAYGRRLIAAERTLPAPLGDPAHPTGVETSIARARSFLPDAPL